MKNLFIISLLLLMQSGIAPAMAQDMNEEELSRKYNLIVDSIKMYLDQGNQPKVLSVCENGRRLLSKDYGFLKELELEIEQLLSSYDEANIDIKVSNYTSLSIIFLETGDKLKQLEYAGKAVNLLEKTGNINDWQYVNSLFHLCTALISNNIYDKAIEIGKRAVLYANLTCKTEETKFGYRNALSCLAKAYFESGDVNNAISIQEQLVNSESNDINKLSDIPALITYYTRTRMYHKKKETCEEYLKLTEDILGKESEEYAVALMYYSGTLDKKGERIMLLQEASKILERLNKTSSTNYMAIQQALNLEISDREYFSNFSSYIGNLEKLYGKKSRAFFHAYFNYLYRKSDAVAEYRMDTVLCTYLEEGEKTLLEVANIFGKEDETYLGSESIMAEIYSRLFKLRYDKAVIDRAIRYQADVASKSKGLYGEDNIKFIRALETLARIKSESSYYYKEADSIQQHVIDYYKKEYGTQHEYYANAIYWLACFYFSEVTSHPYAYGGKVHKEYNDFPDVRDNILPKFQKSIELYNEALTIYKNIGDKEGIARILSYLKWEYDLRGEHEKAAACLKEAFSHWKDETLMQFSMQTSEEKTEKVNSYNWNMGLDSYYSDAFNANSLPTYSEIAYDAQLFSKGLLLSSELGLQEIIDASDNSECAEQFQHLQQIKKEISNATDANDIRRLTKEYQSAERNLMKVSQQYGDYMQNLSMTFSDVKSHLDSKDIAIEFATTIAYDTITNGFKLDYYALTLKSDYSSPKTIRLCSDNNLTNSDSLYFYVWQPLKSELEGVTNVYFAPTMALNNLPIESAQLQDGSLISEHGTKFYRLSSTREIAKQRMPQKYNSAVLYGGLQYDASVADLVSSDTEERANGLRGSNDSIEMLGNNLRKAMLNWGNLPATKEEVTQIDGILQKGKIESKTYTGTKGTESTFKNLSGRHINIIHVATHGFYVKTENQQSEEEQLERSGLIFAGANNVKRGVSLPEGVDDGVLTAAEIARLDLRNLNLVVMSACETGLGDVSSEGVYGLQRGFKKAGAKSIVMSLWPVADYPTQLLMTEFYKQLIKGVSLHDALEDAKLYARSYNKGQYAAAKYWSGFILLDGM